MRRAIIGSTLFVLTLFVLSAPALAQPGPPGRSFQFRFGGFFPAGGGDLWDDNEIVFTQDISDFNDFFWGMSFVAPVNNHLEVGFNVDFYDSTASSAYREFFDDNFFPIFHDTTLDTVPFTIDARWFPAGRYRIRSGGRRVLRPAFFLGAGIGANFWEYEEVGEFIDCSFGCGPLDPPAPILPGRFKDSGTAFQTQLSTGLELPLNPSFAVVLEGRYAWSSDAMSGDFAGFGDIELGGASLFIAASFRF
jgi:hypothetical protein